MQSDQSTLPLSKDADELQSDFIIEGAVNEEEARRRREQLNRRPSYRMILKDLETAGEKPLKKEIDEMGRDQSHAAGGMLDCAPPSYCSPGSSRPPTYNNATNSGIDLLRGLQPLSVSQTGPSSAAHTQINLISTLLPPPPQQVVSRLLVAPPDIPSQPQPQQSGLLGSNNSCHGLETWQSNLLTAASFTTTSPNNSQLHQQQASSHILGGVATNTTSQQSVFNQGPHGLTRAASASLTSLSDNDDTNRKRQVRLMKNREAAKECRRKKKEYALIEELKTLKELYCRKEQKDVITGNGI